MPAAIRLPLIEAKFLQTYDFECPAQFGTDGFLGNRGRPWIALFLGVSGQDDAGGAGCRDSFQCAQVARCVAAADGMVTAAVEEEAERPPPHPQARPSPLQQL